MRWVPSAVVRPHKCACIPFIGGNHPEGFFDFGTEIMAMDGHVYVSVVAARRMAGALGYQPAGGTNPLSAKLKAAESELHEVTMQRDALKRQMDAVQVLKAEGFTAARKPGRPPKVTA